VTRRSLTHAERDWYSQASPMTDVSAHAEWRHDLPADLASLCRIVQGLLIHGHLGPLYGLELSEERRQAETNLRSVGERLEAMLRRDDRPLARGRPAGVRQLGTCRDFTLLLFALLCWQGRVARARCGFAGYFVPGRSEDHWVCEVWDEEAGRWRLVDAQIDDIQRRVFGPDDPHDVGRDEFIVGGEAWSACRSGQLDPGRCGLTLLRMAGLWFVCGDLVRDVAALNKVELLPSDTWGMMLHPALGSEPVVLRADGVPARLPPADLAELDRVSSLASGWIDLPSIRDAYRDPRWRVPVTHPALVNGGSRSEGPPPPHNRRSR
jgi:hypothetical protein